MGKDNANNVNK